VFVLSYFTDYLSGEGTFSSANLAHWEEDEVSAEVTFTSVTINSEDVLKIIKTSAAELAFLKHHLTYKFGSNIKPAHLMFSFYSTDVETEDTNLRLLNTAVTKYNLAQLQHIH